MLRYIVCGKGGVMMGYVALYRQWRPQDFEQLVGQEHISTTLMNAIKANRIAHAYLFSGPRGTGKTSTAKILAKAVNCSNGPTIQPCNACDSCMRITDGRSMDVLEIDAASNRGIDEIRELREKVKFTPVDGRYKVYIIDEVHMLTTEAFNALLKTLEEPPAHVIFILATTEPHRIPATILSRCQRYDFRRIASEDIEGRLREVATQMDVQLEEDAVAIIARAAEGGLRDALSMLDQCIAFGGNQVTGDQVRSMLGVVGEEWLGQMTYALLQRNVSEAAEQVRNLLMMGKDPRQVMVELISRFRNYLIAESTGTISILEGVGELPRISVEEYMDIIQILSDASQEAKWAPHPRIVLELAAIRICRRNTGHDVANLLARIEKLEQLLSGAQVAAAPRIMAKAAVQPIKQTAAPGESIPGNTHALDLVAPVEPVNKKRPVPTREPVQNVEELWDHMLGDLLKNNKRAIHTCLSEGRLVSITDEAVTISFQLPFYKERIEKEDYRGFLEKLIAQITGQPHKLKCCLDSDVAQVEEVLDPSPSPMENPLVQNAVAIFGEQVVTILNK
jgi:DNA polymerase III subunit gamma/tau